MSTLNINTIRDDFPILQQTAHGKPLIYFDNAATSQKPQVVIDALNGYYTGYNANIHRGIHFLAEKATGAFESCRTAWQSFLGAAKKEEVIFTYGTTDGINLIAQTYGRAFLKPGDEIIISTMEHHSNIVPWQMLAEEKGLVLKVIPINQAGELLMDKFEKLLSEKTKIVSVVHVSNALGTINPIKKIANAAHKFGAIVIADGAQAAGHLDIDVVDLDVDFYLTSAHKLFGPTGMGILYGKEDILNAMPPYRGGGEMIKQVSFEKTTYNELPYKFEAGTPNIADVVASRAALDYINQLGKENIRAHEDHLLAYATAAVSDLQGARIIGTAMHKSAVLSFVLEGIHPQDIGVILDQQGIAIRTGHHCTQPLMDWYGIPGTARASFSVFNTTDEIDSMIKGLHKVQKLLL